MGIRKASGKSRTFSTCSASKKGRNASRISAARSPEVSTQSVSMTRGVPEPSVPEP